MTDPVLHSHVSDELPPMHPLAFKALYCVECREMLHASNNECMQTWVETGNGHYCLYCFYLATGECVDRAFGLPEKVMA